MHHRPIWRSTQNEGQKFQQSLLANYSKSTKIAITAYKFFRVSMPRDPLEPFLFLSNQLQIGYAEKNTLEKNMEIMPPPFFLNLSLRHWFVPVTLDTLLKENNTRFSLESKFFIQTILDFFCYSFDSVRTFQKKFCDPSERFSCESFSSYFAKSRFLAWEKPSSKTKELVT